jgi:hypothetical protein
MDWYRQMAILTTAPIKSLPCALKTGARHRRRANSQRHQGRAPLAPRRAESDSGSAISIAAEEPDRPAGIRRRATTTEEKMKRLTFMVIATVAFSVPVTGNSAMYYESFTSLCNNESACIRKKIKDEVLQSAPCYPDDPLHFADIFKDRCHTYTYTRDGQYRYSEYASIYSEQDCASDIKFVVAECDIKQKEHADQRRQKKAQEEKIEKAEKKAENKRVAALESDLRAGRVKPANISQAAIAYSAEIGVGLASAPKIKPDGKLYALPGKIVIANEDSAEFLAQISLGEANDALLMIAGRSHEIDSRYFYVRIPKSLSVYYFDKAQIGRGFDLVGRYVANAKYETVAGQEKSAPIFEAVYFVMW